MTTARRTHGFRESVIRGMTRLAREHDSLNLAQGFPNFPAPEVLKEAAVRAIRADINQYAITWGAHRLRHALARTYAERTLRACSAFRTRSATAFTGWTSIGTVRDVRAA